MSLYVDKLSVESIGTKYEEKGKPKKITLKKECTPIQSKQVLKLSSSCQKFVLNFKI